jgi:hypothetical protein
MALEPLPEDVFASYEATWKELHGWAKSHGYAIALKTDAMIALLAEEREPTSNPTTAVARGRSRGCGRPQGSRIARAGAHRDGEYHEVTEAASRGRRGERAGGCGGCGGHPAPEAPASTDMESMMSSWQA